MKSLMSKNFDVAVVGFGPVGAVLSGLLGRLGVRTVVLEKSLDIYPLPRAIAFDHEIMRVLQNLGVADAVHPHVVPYPSTEYRGVDGKLIARYAPLPAPYPLGWQPGFMFKQPPFERALRGAVAQLPEVDVRLGTSLEAVQQKDDHVELLIRNLDGGQESLRARYAVGCDGGASPTRKLLDVGLESLDFDEPWLVVDVLLEDAGFGKVPQSVVQYCDPDRPTTYVVGSGNHRRWEFMLLPGETAEEMNKEATIWRLLSRWITPEDGKLWRATTYVFHALIANEWRKERIMLAGDAAHMTPPFMAQGMCQGIRDAANLSWKLDLVIKGLSSPQLLDTYQQERRAHVRTTTETAKSLGRIICELDPLKARERDASMLREKGDPPAVQYRQSLIPGIVQGALCPSSGPPVGTLFPQPRIARKEGIHLLDDVVGSSFRLVLSPAVQRDDIPAALRQRVNDLGGVCVSLADGGRSDSRGPGEWSVAEVDGLLEAWFRQHGAIAALVRPDHYVLSIAKQEAELESMCDVVDSTLFLSHAPAFTP